MTVQAVRLAPYKLSYLLTYLLTYAVYALIVICAIGLKVKVDHNRDNLSFQPMRILMRILIAFRTRTIYNFYELYSNKLFEFVLKFWQILTKFVRF